MPVFLAKYNEHRDELEGTYSAELLGTIRVPKNLSLLTERLPKAQYELDKKPELVIAEEPVIRHNELESIKRMIAPVRTSEVAIGHSRAA